MGRIIAKMSHNLIQIIYTSLQTRFSCWPPSAKLQPEDVILAVFAQTGY